MNIKFIGSVKGTLKIKRCNLPGIKVEQKCPVCGHASIDDFDGDSLNYPSIGIPETLYFLCEDCDHGWQERVILCMTINSIDEGLMNKYRKKPVVIEAMQWDGTEESAQKILKWANARWLYVPILQEKHKLISKMIIPTLEGDHNAIPGDFIIKGVKGEFYPCKKDIFEMTYERVEE